MRQTINWLAGLGVGAGLMYLFDPERGRRRRALLRGKAQRALHRLEHAAHVTACDVSHRAHGLAANLRAHSANGATPDRVLVERVRAALGRLVMHPHSITVTATDGIVTVSGPILRREVEPFLAYIAKIHGVRGIENRLEIHDHADIPALAGGRPRLGFRSDWRQESWSPTTRLVAGAAGSALMANCLARRTPVAILLGAAGFGLAVRGVANLPLTRLTGIGCARRAVDVHKTINIAVPIDQVFAFWVQVENFPRFMSHVHDVRDLGGGRSHWIATGPAGMLFGWDAVVTRTIPNELLAWKSEPGSMVASAGCVRFQAMSESKTRVDIHFSYNPPAGALGHVAAHLFGADPKSAMDQDLVRLKSLLETGKVSAHGKRVIREDLAALGRRLAANRLESAH